MISTSLFKFTGVHEVTMQCYRELQQAPSTKCKFKVILINAFQSR